MYVAYIQSPVRIGFRVYKKTSTNTCKFTANMGKNKFNVRFRLEQRKTEDGKVINENVPINADITFNGRRIFYFTGYRIDASKWIDEKKDGVLIQQVRRNNFNAKGESAATINEKLQQIRAAAANIFKRFDVEGITATPNMVRDALKKELNEEKELTQSVVSCFKEYLDWGTKQGWRESTIKKRRTMMAHLKDFRPTACFNDIDENFFLDFKEFLIKDKKHVNSHVAKTISEIRGFLNWATSRGYNKNEAYKRVKVSLDGTNQDNRGAMFSLTFNEFVHLYTMDLSLPHLDRVRDVFCFCCATGMRYSDVKNLKWSNIEDDCIVYTSIKTTTTSVIPMNQFSTGIIKKYEPFKEISEFILPVISNQKYNDYLKDLGKLAGLDGPITKTDYRGAKRVETTKKKWELLTSHVARKTFVTICIDLGIPGDIVRSIIGHKDPAMIARYERFNTNQKSEMMNRFNVSIKPVNVFERDITDDERRTLNIADRDAYMEKIRTDQAAADLDVALLEKLRGNDLESFNIATRLPDEGRLKYMQRIAELITAKQ